MNNDFNTAVALAEFLSGPTKEMAAILGFTYEDDVIPNEISELIVRREVARSTKNFPLADELRNKINSLGWVLEDGPDQVIKVKKKQWQPS